MADLFFSGDSYTTTYFDIYGEQPSLAPGGNPIGNPVFPGITTDGGANWVGVVTAEGYSTLTYNFVSYGHPSIIIRLTFGERLSPAQW